MGSLLNNIVGHHYSQAFGNLVKEPRHLARISEIEFANEK